MGQEESKRANEPDGQSTPTRKRFNSFQRRSNRLSSTSSVRIPQSPTWDTTTATSGSSPGVFEHDSSNLTQLNPFKLPVFEDSPNLASNLKQKNLVASSSLPKFDIPEKPKRSDSLIKGNGTEQFDIYNYSQPEPVYSRSHSDTTAPFSTQTQKSSESIYLSTEDMPFDPACQQASEFDQKVKIGNSSGNLFEGGIQDDETPVPVTNPMFMNLYNPSFDLIDLSPVDDEKSKENLTTKNEKCDMTSSYKDQFFGSSFQKRQRSFELLEQNEDFDFEKTLKANKPGQGSFLMGHNNFGRNQEADALPIFGLYSTQKEKNNSYVLSSPYSLRKTELSVQPLSYSGGSGASKDLIQFSSSEQLDNDDSPEQACRNDGVRQNNNSNSGMDPLMLSETSFDAGTAGLLDGKSGLVAQRDKNDLVLEELMIRKKNAGSQDNLKNGENFAKVSSLEAVEKKSNNSLNIFSPASSTDGIYVINSFERKKNSQSRERSRDSCSSRRAELMDMKYCGEDGRCLVPKTPDDILDDAPKMDAQMPEKQTIRLQRLTFIDDAGLEGKAGKPLLSHKRSQESTGSDFDPMPDFEPPPPMNLPTKALKTVDSEVKRKTGSLRLFEETEEECLSQIGGGDNEGLLAIAEISPIAKEFNDHCSDHLENYDQDTGFVTDAKTEEFFEPPENIYATLVKPKNRKSSMKHLHDSPHASSPSCDVTAVEDPKLPNMEEILSEEAKKQNCNTFVRKKSQSSQNDSSTGKEENSDEQRQQNIQNNSNSGTFVRRKSLLKTPVSYKKLTASSSTEMIVDDTTAGSTELFGNGGREENLEKNLNSGTFLRPANKLPKSALNESKNSENDPENNHNSGTFLRSAKKLAKCETEEPKYLDNKEQRNNQTSGTFLRSPKKLVKGTPDENEDQSENKSTETNQTSGTFVRPAKKQTKSSSPQSSSPDNDPETNSHAGTFVRPKKKLHKNLIDAPHKVAANAVATIGGEAKISPDNAGMSQDETIECEKRILAFKTGQSTEESEQKSFQTHVVQDVDRVAVSLLTELIEDKLNYLKLHLQLKSELRSTMVVFSEQSIEDVWALEKKFSDLHRQYEALKPHYEYYKDSATDAKRHISQLHQQIDEQSDLKTEVTRQVETMFERGEEKTKRVTDHWSQKIAQLEAEIKLQTFKNNQLSEKVQQKEKENIQVAKLCDEMIAKLNENTEPSTPL